MLYGPAAISPQPVSLADSAGIVKHRSCKNLLHITRERAERDARRPPEHGHMTHSERRTRNTLQEDLNPLWYLNKVRNKRRDSRPPRQDPRPRCTRLFPSCPSGFQLREPELSESQRVHRASPSLSDISVNLPHRDPLCPVSRWRAVAGTVIQTSALPTIFYSTAFPQQGDRLHDVGYFHPFTITASGWMFIEKLF